MINYFQDKTINDFKNSKKFWEFYSSYIQIKSDKSFQRNINKITYDSTTAENDFDIGNLFNKFFTSLKSSSTITEEESINFTKRNLENLFRTNKLKKVALGLLKLRSSQ